MGSVKELIVFAKPTLDAYGLGNFRFSDRFSVFDYGEMPDLISGKGSALAIMAAVGFERLADLTDVKSHYEGLTKKNNETVSVFELTEPSDVMDVKLVNVIKPIFEDGSYDYSEYCQMILQNCLIPFEVIYRNRLPKGSSVFGRLEKKTLHYSELGLNLCPVEGQTLLKPYFELTTKLEKTDRFVSFDQAAHLIGIFESEIEEIKYVLKQVERVISTIAAEAGLDNDDGKIELAFSPDKEIIVVDVFGTPDECRFTYKGVQLSKEILRQYYKKTTWYNDVVKAKDKAVAEKVEDWQQFCSKPEPLPKDLLKLVSNLYMSMANAFVKKNLFEGVPNLDVVSEEYVKFWAKYQ